MYIEEAERKIDVLRKMQIHGHIFVGFRNTRPSMLKIRRVDTDDYQIHFRNHRACLMNIIEIKGATVGEINTLGAFLNN